jgi:hypothetical protein
VNAYFHSHWIFLGHSKRCNNVAKFQTNLYQINSFTDKTIPAMQNNAVAATAITASREINSTPSTSDDHDTYTTCSQPAVLVAQAVLVLDHNQEPAVTPARTFPRAQHNLSMDMAIDQAVARRQQSRQLVVAEGAVVVEASSSIGIDLDRVDAIYQNLGQRTYISNFFRRYVNRYFQILILLTGMVVAWIVATPIFWACNALGFDSSDLRLHPVFPSAKVAYVFIMFGIVQPLGAGIMYVSNQLEERMLPQRCHGGNGTIVLLSGACCFCDNLLSRKQFWCLFFTSVCYAAGLYLCGGASVLLLFGLQPKANSDMKFIFMWIGLSLPAVAWYQLAKYLHTHYLQKCEGTSRSYDIITADAVNGEPMRSHDLEML